MTTVLHRARCFVAGLVLAAAVLGVTTPQAAALAPTGKITLSRDGEIWVMNSDGTAATNLQVAGHRPQWSRDGRRIGFESSGAFTTMNGDGSNQTTHGADIGDFPAWSPDGTKLVFTRFVEGSGQKLIVSSIDGLTETQLIPGLGTELFPTWSPDGTRIAFQSNLPSPRVWIVNADGTDLHEVPNQPAGVSGVPRFSPDGLKIVFVNDPTGDEALLQLFTIGIDGSALSQVGPTDANVMWPSFSSDGTKILYSSMGASPGLYVMNVDGSDAVRIGNETSEASWQPTRAPVFNGKITFSAGRPGAGEREIFTVNPDGTGRTKIADGVFASYTQYGSKIGYVAENGVTTMNPDGSDPHVIGQSYAGFRLSWSADGSKYVFMSGNGITVVTVGEGEVTLFEDDVETEWNPALSPDGTKLVYFAEHDDSAAIWISDVDGKNANPVITALEGDASYPYFSPDGAKIAYEDHASGRILIANVDGTDAHPAGPSGYLPSFSPDGQWLTFVKSEANGIWVMRVDGSDARQITFGADDSYFPGPSWQPLASEPSNLPPRAFGTAQNKQPLALLASAALSYDFDGTIVRYEWRWGDNTPMSPYKYVWHKYKEPGTYLVRLTVVDDDGAKTTRKAWVKVA